MAASSESLAVSSRCAYWKPLPLYFDMTPFPSASDASDLRGARVLQIFNRYLQYGGEEGSVYRIGDALQERFSVEYFFESTQTFLGDNALKNILLPLIAWRNVRAVRRLRKLHAIGKFDLWQIHNVFPALSPAVYLEAFENGIPVLQYLHNYRLSCTNGFFLNHGAPCTTCIKGNFVNAALTACWHDSHAQSAIMGLILADIRRIDVFKKVTRWVAISHAQKQIHVQMGVPSDRIDVIPHFLEPKSPPPTWPRHGKVMFVGRLSAEKGVDYLLRAWSLLEGRPLELVIVGDGPERANLENLSRELALERVAFHGFCKPEEMRRNWEQASVVVVPSVWEEPFGMVVLEAWAQKRPVVAFRAGALAEIICHEADGLLVDPRSIHGLANAIQALMSDPSRAQAMGEQGFTRLHDEFSRKLWLERMTTTYQKALNPR